jgi:chromosome segregation ATPase
MARGGIYKAEVQRARDRLLAQGTYPSIDAVRSELGNTGSKTTIHRYLKEIDESDGGTAVGKVVVSEVVQDLVGRLAGRLHEEADGRIEAADVKHRAQIAQVEQRSAALEALTSDLRGQLERSQFALKEELGRHQKTEVQLNAEVLERARLAQQVGDLQELLKAAAAHRESLDEKYRHAREALESLRRSAKEQRDQELRLHEHQLGFLQVEIRTLNQSLAAKQHEVAQAEQENARLASEVSQGKASLASASADLQKMEGVSAKLAAAGKDVEALRQEVFVQAALIEEHAAEKLALRVEVDHLLQLNRQLEIDLAAARAVAATQDGISEKLQALIELAVPRDKPVPSKPRTRSAALQKAEQETLFEK